MLFWIGSVRNVLNAILDKKQHRCSRIIIGREWKNVLKSMNDICNNSQYYNWLNKLLVAFDIILRWWNGWIRERWKKKLYFINREIEKRKKMVCKVRVPFSIFYFQILLEIIDNHCKCFMLGNFYYFHSFQNILLFHWRFHFFIYYVLIINHHFSIYCWTTVAANCNSSQILYSVECEIRLRKCHVHTSAF